ncbi:MAG: diguanylate cyclase, partial [Enterococcus aquimarinus]
MKTESNRTNPVTPSFIQFLNNSNDYTKTIDNLRRLELPPEIMAQYLTFMQSAPVPVIFVDRNETILFTNKTIEFKLGKNQSELIGHSISDVIPLRLNEGDKQAIIDEVRLNNHWNGRLSYIDNENNTKRSWIKVTRFENPPNAPTYGILFFDTDSVNYRDFSDHSLTYYDTKTFLPNFNQFAFDINQMARKRDSDVKGLALIRCHNLSEITVHYSRKIMDEVTNTMIRRIKKALPCGYYLYRLSRDVFAVFCSKCKNEASFKELIEELYQTLLTPLSIDSKKIFLTIEMGVVFYPTQ